MEWLQLQKCMNYLIEIHDILDSAVSKWIGNMAHILACLFKSSSREQHEFWPSQFPFLHNIKDSLLSVRRQSKAKGWFLVYCAEMVFARVWWCLWQISLTLILSLTAARMAESQLEVCIQVPQALGRGGAMGDGIPDVLWSLTSSPSSSSVVQVVQVGTLLKFLDQWRSITSNRDVLNMVKDQHLQLRYHTQLFHNLG